MKKIVAMFLCVLMIFSLGACSGGSTGDSSTLKIMVWNSGYGTKWIEDLKTEYLKTHSNVRIDISDKSGDSGTGEIYNTITTGAAANDTDLYFAYGPKYLQYTEGSENCLEPLNDVVNYTVPGESKTIGQKIGSTILDALVYENNYYALSYENGAYGIVYNAKLFEEFGFEVPRTTNELDDLVRTAMVETKYNGVTAGPANTTLAPIVHYPGYWGSAVINWWLQYEGRTNFDTFFSFSNFTTDELLNMQNHQSKYQQIGLRKGLEALYEIISPTGHTYAGSNSADYITLQSRFIEEETSLIYPCGGWLESEMLKGEGFDANLMNNFKLMKYPVLSAVSEKLSAGNQTEEKLIALIDYVDGVSERPNWATDNDVETVRFARTCSTTQAAANTVIIPSYASSKDLAKDFLKFVYSDTGLKIFAEAQKCFMAVDFDNASVKESINTASWSAFSKSVYEISESKENYVPQKLNHPLYFRTRLQEVFPNTPPEVSFTDSTKATVESFLDYEWAQLMLNWPVYLSSAGLK